jgi:hypothetical protein
VTSRPDRLIADIAADLTEVRRLLQRAPSPSVRADLLRVSAQMSALMADSWHSTGEFGAAWRWWRTARRAADASGDCELRVWVRARESFNTLHSDRPASRALALADEARDIADRSPSLGLVEAHKNRAYVLARRGDRPGARQAIGEMRETYQKLPARTTADGASMWGWPERIIHLAESYTYATLGTPEAASATERALAAYPTTWRTDVTKLKLLQAMTLIRDGDVGGGLRHAVTIINALPEVSRRTSVKRVGGEVLAALPGKAHALPTARELRALTN